VGTLFNDLRNLKMGSPLRADYKDSLVSMYNKMPQTYDLPVTSVIEKEANVKVNEVKIAHQVK